MPDINGSLTADTECVDSPRRQRRDLPDRRRARRRPSSTSARCHPARLGDRRAVGGRHLRDHAGAAPPRPVHHLRRLRRPRRPARRARPTPTPPTPSPSSSAAPSRRSPRTSPPTCWRPAAGLPHLGGWFEVGGDDGDPLAAAQKLAPLAAAAGIATCLSSSPTASTPSTSGAPPSASHCRGWRRGSGWCRPPADDRGLPAAGVDRCGSGVGSTMIGTGHQVFRHGSDRRGYGRRAQENQSRLDGLR